MLSVPPPPLPVQQVIVVRAPAWDSTRATLRRFELRGDMWRQLGKPARAWVGANGFAPQRTRRQNTGQTPAGTFTLPSAFGRPHADGVRLPYHRIGSGSYWPYDPKDPRTYNVLQDRRAKSARWRADGEWSERLIDYGRAYRWGVVIGYNLPEGVYRDATTGERRATQPARTDKGGGIFLHVERGRPTAGCVAVSLRQMHRIVTWLDPAASPRLVMGPQSVTRSWRDINRSV